MDVGSSSSFFKKKDPAPTREEKGRIRPDASNSLVYLSLPFRSGEVVELAGRERSAWSQVNGAVIGMV